jgi:hypothetical protein
MECNEKFEVNNNDDLHKQIIELEEEIATLKS